MRVEARPVPGAGEVLTDDALAFVVSLIREHGPRLSELLDARIVAQERYDSGSLPDLDPGTRAVRDGDWRCPALPPDLLDRRVEITGPVDRKMVVNALNSGANVFMAD